MGIGTLNLVPLPDGTFLLYLTYSVMQIMDFQRQKIGQTIVTGDRVSANARKS